MQKPKLSSTLCCRPQRSPEENIHRIKFSLRLNKQKKKKANELDWCNLFASFRSTWRRAPGRKSTDETKLLRWILKHFCFKASFCWSSLAVHKTFQLKMLNVTCQSCFRSPNYLVIIQRILLHKRLDKFFWSNIIKSLLNKAHKQSSQTLRYLAFQKEKDKTTLEKNKTHKLYVCQLLS